MMRLAIIFSVLVLAGSVFLFFSSQRERGGGPPFPQEDAAASDSRTSIQETAESATSTTAPAAQEKESAVLIPAPLPKESTPAPSLPKTEQQRASSPPAENKTKIERESATTASPLVFPTDTPVRVSWSMRKGDRYTIPNTEAVMVLTSVEESTARVQVREGSKNYSYTLAPGATLVLPLTEPEVVALEAESILADNNEARFSLWRYPRTKVITALPAQVALRVGQTAAIVHRPDFVERVSLLGVERLHAKIHIETLVDAGVTRVFSGTYQKGDTLGAYGTSMVLDDLSYDNAYNRANALWGPHTVTLVLLPAR